MYYGEVKIPNAEMDAFISAANSLSIRGLCSLSQMPLVLEGATTNRREDDGEEEERTTRQEQLLKEEEQTQQQQR